VSSLMGTSEHREPLFACLELKRCVSSLVDGNLSCLLEGSEHRHPLLACLEWKRSASSLIDPSETDNYCSLDWSLNEFYLAR